MPYGQSEVKLITLEGSLSDRTSAFAAGGLSCSISRQCAVYQPIGRSGDSNGGSYPANANNHPKTAVTSLGKQIFSNAQAHPRRYQTGAGTEARGWVEPVVRHCVLSLNRWRASARNNMPHVSGICPSTKPIQASAEGLWTLRTGLIHYSEDIARSLLRDS